jgi:hypothetical protein
MSDRKIRSQLDIETKKVLPQTDLTEILQLLQLLEQKVLASSVLNGGFDAMMSKVDQIDDSQKQIVVKVDSIHQAIYHPDDGLFARVKDVEHVKDKVIVVDRLEKDLTHIQTEREHENVHAREASQLSKDNEKAIKELTIQVRYLVELKSRMSAIGKWLAVTVSGGVLATVGKLLYEFASGHITIH